MSVLTKKDRENWRKKLEAGGDRAWANKESVALALDTIDALETDLDMAKEAFATCFGILKDAGLSRKYGGWGLPEIMSALVQRSTMSIEMMHPNQWIADAINNPWSLDFDEYQTAAATTADYARMGRNPNYPALGLASEAGEVCEHIKKIERNNAGIITRKRRHALKKEIGDVLWYIATLCTELDLSMADVAQGNLDKLADRHARGVIHGSGDER